MPDDAEPAPETGGKKSDLKADWNKMKGWQKAGVIIAGAGLVLALVVYWQKQQGGQTGSALAPSSAGTQATDYAGHGDIYPSLPVYGSSGAGSVPPVTTGTVTPPVGTSPIHWHPGPIPGPVIKAPTTTPVKSFWPVTNTYTGVK